MISRIPMHPAIGTETVQTLERTLGQGRAANSDFSTFLEGAIEAVNRRQIEADAALMNTATGENVDIHSQMIALEEANISIRTRGSARDKIVEAYQSIWNLQI